MRLLIITFLLASFAASSASAEGEISLYDFMKAKNAEVFDSSDAIMYNLRDERLQYYVTKSNHPAHPYIIKNKIRGRAEGTWFKVTGFGDGDNGAAEFWMEQIKRVNDAKIAKIRGEI